MDGSQRAKVAVSPRWSYLWVIPALILDRLDSLSPMTAPLGLLNTLVNIRLESSFLLVRSVWTMWQNERIIDTSDASTSLATAVIHTGAMEMSRNLFFKLKSDFRNIPIPEVLQAASASA